jgi:hypothetical protein
VRYLLLFFITTQLSIQARAQKLDLKILTKAYNATSVQSAFKILKEQNGFLDKVFLTNRLGDSTIILYFGNDSLTARRQTGRIIIHCSVLKEEKLFLDLKQQASKNFKQIETANAESMGVVRNHFVYGQTKPLRKGDLRIILTKCFDKERSLTYCQFNLFPYPGY